MKIDELDTPALIVDEEVMAQNLQRMSSYCRQHNLDLRPHTKTHKTPELAQEQLGSGACGITVAKIGEAEVMSEEGLDDMLLAYPVFGASKAARLNALLERVRLSVALDSEDSANWVSRAVDGKQVGILVEIDLGMRRCGLHPGPDAVRLARFIESTPGLDFQGLLFYPGHIHPEYDEDTHKLQELDSELRKQLELFEEEKIPVPRVSGGSTPSAFHSHHISGLTEIRPGTYIFNDRNTIEWGSCKEENCAAAVLCTVVSTSVPGQAIIDGGSKTFSSDPLRPGDDGGHGLVRNLPEVEFVAMNEEHGYLKLPPHLALESGQRVQIIPNHICTTVNLHEVIFGYLGEEVVHSWPVRARGKIR